MTLIMSDAHIHSIAQIKKFLQGATDIQFQGVSRKERYAWIEQTLMRFRYFRCTKGEKSVLKTYLMTMTGYSDAQITRLVAKKRRYGKIGSQTTRRHRFKRTYLPRDIALLTKTDNAHLRLSGPATKHILVREYTVFGKQEYAQIQHISPSHIYNLRKTRQYTSHALTVLATQSQKSLRIGERRKPTAQGQPGFVRVDTVHQGDLDKEKGVYHINVVDEVTQWEVVGCIEKISEYHLAPLLADLIEQYPFVLQGFHSDNGSEYVNKVVAELLNKLLIRQTKSRTRHCNDNALAEGKNGSIVRKHMGRRHIPQRYAPAINQFYKAYFNGYLNYHRPCGFASIKTDRKGKEKKVYDTYLTPYERFHSLPHADQYLKERVTMAQLDTLALRQSDNECAAVLQKAKEELFTSFKHTFQIPTMFTTFVSGSSVD